MIFNFFKWTSFFLGSHYLFFKLLKTRQLIDDLALNYLTTNLLFIITSFITISVVYLLAKKNNQFLGFVYLVLLTFKTILCYIFFEDVLNTPSPEFQFEKINILLMFFFFMGLEVTQTAKVLNNIEYKSTE